MYDNDPDICAMFVSRSANLTLCGFRAEEQDGTLRVGTDGEMKVKAAVTVIPSVDIEFKSNCFYCRVSDDGEAKAAFIRSHESKFGGQPPDIKEVYSVVEVNQYIDRLRDELTTNFMRGGAVDINPNNVKAFEQLAR